MITDALTPFFSGAGLGQLHPSTHCFSIISCPSGGKPTLLSLPYFTLAAPSLWNILFPFSSWLILTYLSNLSPHASSVVKPSPSYPPSPCAPFLCVHPVAHSHLFEPSKEKPGHHLVSHHDICSVSTVLGRK